MRIALQELAGTPLNETASEHGAALSGSADFRTDQ
jgi:hypothetical protein